MFRLSELRPPQSRSFPRKRESRVARTDINFVALGPRLRGDERTKIPIQPNRSPR